jgi:hypothetical protein
MLLSQHQIKVFQPPPVEITETAVAIFFRVALAPLLPNQLQRQVLVPLQVLVDLRPVRLRMFAPNGRNGSSWNRACSIFWSPQFSGVGHLTPAVCARTSTGGRCSEKGSNRERSDASSIRGNGAAELPSTCAWSVSSVATGVSTYQWSPSATAALRRRSNPMPITVPNHNQNPSASVRNTDRHHFGMVIDISSER